MGVFQRFTSLDALQGIGQNLLVRFLEPFTADLVAKSIPHPSPNLPEHSYFQAVANLFTFPELLPHRLTEALFAIAEIATPQSRQHLQAALTGAGIQVLSNDQSPPEKLAIEVWLALPAWLASLEHYTLEPLQTEGADALRAAGVNGISKARLVGIEIASDNLFHETTSRKADDLFACASAGGTPSGAIPTSGQLTRALLEIEFTDSQQCAIEIRPPKSLHLPAPHLGPLIKRWLTSTRFRSLQRLGQMLLAFSLALAAAAAPALDADDSSDDDDDDDPDHIVHHSAGHVLTIQRFNASTL